LAEGVVRLAAAVAEDWPAEAWAGDDGDDDDPEHPDASNTSAVVATNRYGFP
jgi:hypothetical protein